MTDILNADSPRWNDFVYHLEDAVFPDPDREDTWLCDGDNGPHVYRHAKLVMAGMGNIDDAASIKFFKAHGGHCDCEILLNVDEFVRRSRMKRTG